VTVIKTGLPITILSAFPLIIKPTCNLKITRFLLIAKKVKNWLTRARTRKPTSDNFFKDRFGERLNL